MRSRYNARARRPGIAERWTRWAGKGFFALAGLAFAAFVVALVLSSTVFGAPKGCEECTPHISVVLLSITLLLLTVLCGFVGMALYGASQWLGRSPAAPPVGKRRS